MTIDDTNWGEVVQLLRAAARAEIMPRFRKLAPGMVREKSSPSDLVTEADEAAEAFIVSGLHRMFPGCLVVGEEACAADPTLVARLGSAELAFVVDPIDGTSNYVAGLPLFGVMAAAVVNGHVVAGAIHDPVGDDTALAVRGGGAWMVMPGSEPVRLFVADPVPPNKMAGCVSWRFMKEPLRGTVVRNMVGLGGVCDYRCAAHEYRMLAAGHCEYLVFNRLMPWDHLPGWLLHQEAGGFSAHFDGSPLAASDTDGGLICTPDRASFDAISATLFAPG
ncbi:inositol monophosphatase family protein [Acidisphaera sp. L21]|uniref:inositol monophosphatase family protein n=1 Tax=Acidisphaera sp. L21 TaxID=1641851 RepID=UPI00131B7DD0|nr:inositol monophosphatase family protein [Acidisphaera sp. L21]